jgi:acyl dehydratase
MPLNFDLAGKAYDPVEVTVTAEDIERYAAASSDDNPRYRSGPDQIGSPVFPVVPGFGLLAAVWNDPELNVENPLMIVHGEEDLVYHRPIRPGDTLTLLPTLESVDDKGTGATFVAKVAATGTAGEPVVDTYATIFVRGGGSGEPRPRGEKAAQPQRGEVVATFTQHVDVGMPERYADASGDHNPIHLDDDVAKAVGLPGVINHGLGTLSLVSGGLVEHLAEGDAGRLHRLTVRFTDMVLPGSDVATTVWDSPDGPFLFETTRPDGAVVMAGAVEVGAA